MAHPHGSRRIGVGDYSVAASRPFSRRFFDSLDRSDRPARRFPPPRLTFRLGNLPGWPTAHLHPAAP